MVRLRELTMMRKAVIVSRKLNRAFTRPAGVPMFEKNKIISMLVLIGLVPIPAFAAGSWQLNFGPFAGSGTISDREKVRLATGVELQASRSWTVAEKLN
jgi:hypothetical protein